jgi:hypothetical protein
MIAPKAVVVDRIQYSEIFWDSDYSLEDSVQIQHMFGTGGTVLQVDGASNVREYTNFSLARLTHEREKMTE